VDRIDKGKRRAVEPFEDDVDMAGPERDQTTRPSPSVAASYESDVALQAMMDLSTPSHLRAAVDILDDAPRVVEALQAELQYAYKRIEELELDNRR
jgi:hypothetical protein